MNRIITKNTEGIRDILHLLNLIDDHNVSYYKGTINYMQKEHQPFPNSFIYYHPVENSFKFISKQSKKTGSLLTRFKSIKWEGYTPNDLYWIQEGDGFAYFSKSPFPVIVGLADWVLYNSSIDELAMKFHDYIKREVKKEREIWRAKLNPDEKEIVPLF